MNSEESKKLCCGGPAPESTSCCLKDFEAKQDGKSGCGCKAEAAARESK